MYAHLSTLKQNKEWSGTLLEASNVEVSPRVPYYSITSKNIN